MSWCAMVGFLAGVAIGQLTLVLWLTVTRGPGRDADEHEEGGV